MLLFELQETDHSGGTGIRVGAVWKVAFREMIFGEKQYNCFAIVPKTFWKLSFLELVFLNDKIQDTF